MAKRSRMRKAGRRAKVKIFSFDEKDAESEINNFIADKDVINASIGAGNLGERGVIVAYMERENKQKKK